MKRKRKSKRKRNKKEKEEVKLGIRVLRFSFLFFCFFFDGLLQDNHNSDHFTVGLIYPTYIGCGLYMGRVSWLGQILPPIVPFK